MTNIITQQVIASYDAKIKKRLEHRPKDEGCMQEWLEEINSLIFECNNLCGYEKYKMQKDDKGRDNS